MSEMMTRWSAFLVIVIGGASIWSANCALAQVTPDGTLPNNSTITQEGNTSTITGGTQAGGNLFHSFREFSVPGGGTAYFNNAVDIQNIISRVTGGSVSNIDGLIKAMGTANLFLINPNGIIFGPNARLDIGGSFLGSTASSLKFADGYEFSATPSQDEPLLTITAPIGLGMGSNPGEIQVRGPGHDINFPDIKQQPRFPVNSDVPGLELKEGNTLALVGGKVSVEGGIIKSSAGRIEIGSVASNGTVSLIPIQEGWKLDYSGTPSFGDIQFSGKSFVDTTGVGGGSIAVAGRNVSLTGESILLAETLGDRNAGEISIVGDSIFVIESEINSSTFSSGNAGQVKLVANKSILLENRGGAGTNTQGLGKAGEITLKADSIEIRNRSGLGSSTFGKGNAGRIEVEANSLLIENDSGFGTTSSSEGDAGEMNIVVGDFVIRDSAGLGVETQGAGNAGKINITANSLRIEDSSSFNSFSSGTGNAGKINITANSLLIENGSGFDSATKLGSTGQGGEINLHVAGSVVFRNWAGIDSSTSGTGNAGKISIKANSLLVENRSGFSSATQQGSTGQAGEINLHVAGSVVFRNSAGIDSNTLNKFNAGLLTVSAESLEISNNSGIGARTTDSGNAGELSVRVKTLFLNDGDLRLESTGNGNAGTLNIVADTIKLDNHSLIDATTTSSNGGNLTLDVANLLLLRRRSVISTTAGTQQQPGNGGNIIINAPSGFIIAKPGENSDITANAFSGSGGRITINATGIFGIAPLTRQELERLRPNDLDPRKLQTNDITAISQTNPSLSGTIQLNTPDIDLNSALINLPSVPVDTQVAQSCTAGGTIAKSQFTITGRGGLPPNPGEALNTDAVQVDLITLNPEVNKPSTPAVSINPTSPTPDRIVEATGWVINANGNVIFTANAPTVTPHSSWQRTVDCRA